MKPPLRWPTSDTAGVEAALLWSIRAWAVDCLEPTFIASNDRIAQFWSSSAMSVVAEYIDGMMWALAHGRRRSLRVHRLGRPEISADEAALLGAIARARASRDKLVIATLSGMVTPGAAAAICNGAHQMRCVLSAAGYALSQDEAMLLERAAPRTVLPPTGSVPFYLH